MLRIAITGASGFCGSHLAEAAAAAGAEVRCLGRRPGPVGTHVRWDAAAEAPHLSGADLVVHCAAAVGDHPPGSPAEAEQHAVNVDGTARLLEAAAGTPVVLVSSASVYDPRTDRSLVREDHPTGGGHRNAYGRTKAAADRLALQAGAVVLRPRAVYGPGDPHLMPRLLERVRRGLLLLPGPDVPLSLTAVQNLAEACLAAAEWAPGAYNITDAEPYRRDAAVRTVLATQGVRARIGHVPVAAAEFAARRGLLPGLTPYAVDQLARPVVLDTTRAADQGFRPRWELTSALSATNDHECATPAKIT